MKPRAVRLSADYEARLQKVKDFYGVSGGYFSDEFRKLLEVLSECIDNQRQWQQTEETLEKSKAIFCQFRKTIEIPHRNKKTGEVIWKEKNLVCSRNPPTFKKAFLPLCDICQANKFHLKLTENTIVEQPKIETPLYEESRESQVAPKPQPQPIKKELQPIVGWENYSVRSDGSKVCPFGGYVYPANCKRCKEADDKNKWETCVALHYQLQTNPSAPRKFDALNTTGRN